MGGKTQKIGNFGEDYTAKYLKKHGYKILKRNFRSKFGEIDIIAANKKIIAFVEVKARGENALFMPREAVDYFKQKKCVSTAKYYLLISKNELQPRFDISEIIYETDKKGKFSVKLHNYIENAFSEV